MGPPKMSADGSSAKPDIITGDLICNQQLLCHNLQVNNLKANDTRAQHIGKAGQQLINSVLTPSNVRLYW